MAGATGGSIVETTDASFKKEVLESATPVLVDFWAPWCAPCRALAPTVEAFAQATLGKVKVVKHNTEDHEATASEYGVTSIPTLVVFKGGKEVHRVIGGGRSVEDLKKIVSQQGGVQL